MATVNWNTEEQKSYKIKNNCFKIISISNLNAKNHVCVFMFCVQINYFCVVVVLHISPTVLKLKLKF